MGRTSRLIPWATCARCRLPRMPWRPLILSYWGKPYCSSCCGFVAFEHDRNDTWPEVPR